MKTITEYLVNNHIKDKTTPVNVKCQYFVYDDEYANDWLDYMIFNGYVDNGDFKLSKYAWSNTIKCLSFENSDFIYIYFYPAKQSHIIEVAAVYTKTKDIPYKEDFDNAEHLKINAQEKLSKCAQTFYRYIKRIYDKG